MAGNDVFSAIWSGRTEFDSVTKQIESNVHKATVSAIRANQNKIKAAVRANLKGAPRWTERAGKAHGGKAFQVPGTTGQHNSPRSGGPGTMTGDLLKGVGGKKLILEIAGTHIGGVGIGKNINNLKKGNLEAKFPYFRPAVEKVEPLMAATFDKGWDKAINKLGGSIL